MADYVNQGLVFTILTSVLRLLLKPLRVCYLDEK